MNWDTFQIIADKIISYGHTEAVGFAGMGEPTLNPNLPRFIEYVKGRLATWITTNASALTSRNIEKLIEGGLGTVIVSFNGADATTYELMMGGLDFRRAQTHLQDLVQRANGRMKVVANVSVTRQTEPHLTEIKHYLKELGVTEVIFSKCHNRGGHLKNPEVCMTPLLPATVKRCDIFDGTLFVAWNGDVLACCHDLDGVGRLGNLLTDSISDLDQLKIALRGKGAIFEMCVVCNDLYRFGGDQTPDGRPLSQWIYDLYAAESESLAKLVDLLHQRESQVREMEQRAAKAEKLVMAYEKGRFIRFMRGVRQLLHPL